MIGDHKQFLPLVKSKYSFDKNYKISLFGQLVNLNYWKIMCLNLYQVIFMKVR